MSDDDQEEDDDDGEKDCLSLLARNDSHRKKSLEALFQVTKSELKRMKCSRDDVEEQELDDGDDVSSKVEPQVDEIRCGVAAARARHRCPFCGLDCGRSNVLKKHVRRMHHTTERPHQCVPCGIAFKTKSNLYKHCKSRAHQQCSTTASAARPNNEGEEDDELFRWRENDETEDNDSLASDSSEPRDGRVASNTALEVRALPSSSTPVVVAASTSTTTSIYKPKFHLTAHTPTPTSSTGSAAEVRPLTPPPDSSAVFSPPPAHSSYTAFLPTSSYAENEEPNQNNEDGPVPNRTKRSLAKRRHENFRLRLEIPEATALQQRHFDVEPFVDVALKPPPPPSCANLLDAGVSLTGSLKSPMASPEFLQQHISKLISQNAAIVDTLNPLWPRRYARQSSSGGGSSSSFSTNRVVHPANDPHETEAGLKSPALNEKRIRRVDEIVVPHSSSSSNCASESTSHLARALLANNDDSFCASKRTHFAKAPPSPLHNTFSSSSSVLRSTEASKNSSTSASTFTYRGCSAFHSPSSNDDDDDEDDKDNDQVEDVHLNDTRRRNVEITSSAGRDPQNPEGSIIKDLLLKARSSSATVQSSSSCVRLSGGSISVVHLPQLHGEYTIKDDDSSRQFVCHVCQQATFRSAENLEIHQAHYCLQRVSATSVSVAPASSSEELASRRRTFHHLQKSSPSSSTSVGSGIGGVKPRGRPKGSKNRPKVDVQMTMGKSRVHSKSLCEYSSSQDDSMTATTLDFRTRTVAGTAPGPAPAKFSYRRNSVSGVPLSESIKDILTSSFQSEQGIASGGGADGLLVTTEGPILKKHLLLGGDRSPPLKKRKIPVNVEWSASSSPPSESTKNRLVTTTTTTTTSTSSLKSLEHLSRHPMPRPNSSSSSSVCLFGGEVQVYDAYVPETKTISVDVGSKLKPAVLKTTLEKNNEDGDDINDRDEDASSSVVATIAKPVHNSGGVLLQVCDRQATDNSLKSATSQLVSAAVGRPLMATGCSDARSGRSTTTFANLSGATVLAPHRTTPSREFSIDISHLNLKAMTTAADNVVKTSRSDDYGLLSEETLKKMERIRQSEVPSIAVHSPPNSPPKDEQEDELDEAAEGQKETKRLHALQRPTSLLLNSSAIRHSSMVGTTLVSPETPRPEKKYGQCYINGQYYTYLELKHSTRVYYCCIGRPQPMYVPQSTDPKLSMYSVWQTVPQDPDSISPVRALGLYNSRPHCPYTVAAPAETPLQTTHSSYWKFRQQSTESSSAIQRNDQNKDDVAGWPERLLERKSHSSKEMETIRLDRKGSSKSIGRVDDVEDDQNVNDGFVDNGATPSDDGVLGQKASRNHSNAVASSSIGCIVDAGDQLHRVRIFEGGFKSNESYTYVRGRGRGKYVCEDCGIRCKKPSMLKKHVRTHTDLRPYACNHCSFSFKTKGNLTKHMKSKAHHKKCTEMGIVPVPVSIDDVQIDEEALARQERIEHQRRQFANDDDDSDIDDDEDEDYDDDECEGDDFMMTTMQSYEDGDDSLEEGQFEDADRVEGLPTRTRMGAEYFTGNSPTPEQEVIARSLLDLGRPDASAHRLLDQSLILGVEKFEEVALARPLTPLGPLLRDRECDDEPLSVDQPMDLSMPHSRAVDEEEAKDEEGDIADGYVSYSPDQLKPYDDHAVKGNPELQTQHRDRRSPYSTSGGLLQSYLLSDKGKDTEVVAHARGRYDEASQRHHHSVDFNAGGDDIKPQSSVPGCPSSSSYRYSTTQLPTSTNAVSQPHGHHRNLGNRASSEVAASTAASGLSPTSSLAGMRRVSSSSSSSAAFVQRPMDQGEGKCVCNICNKMFTRPSQLRLHVNIHYFERPFRCESCAISFRTKGHLQKHKRSISHYNKVNMNLAFGTPSTDNPRPFKCGDCKIAFRIHGHLAKHLRSKMHIMKLECLGKLPFGTYAEIERSGASLNEIDTSDCDNSLESLQTMAMRLVDKDGLANASTSAAAAAVTAAANARQLWPRERTISGGSIGDDQSDGVPYVESPGELNPPPHNQHAHSQGHSGTSSRLYVMDRGSSGGRAGGDSPDMTEVGGLVKWSQKAAIMAPHIKSGTDVKHEVVNSSSGDRTGMSSSSASSSSPRRSASVKVVVMVERDLHGDEDESPGDYVATRNYYSSGSGVISAGSGGREQYGIEDISADEDEELEAMDSSISKDVTSTTPAGAAGPYCRRVCQSPRMMMTSQPASVSTWKDSSETGSMLVRECDLCGEIFHNAHTLKQHLLVHSRLRPFVCDWCDAGFTTAHLLNVHHHQVHDRQHEDYKELVCTRCGQSFASSVDLKCHQLECLQSSAASSPPRLFTSTTTTVKPRDPGADRFGRDPT